MSDSTKATVETLTAEVRTLVVGSRQVTMSVFNQLDRVAPGQIEPMGRVSPRDALDGVLYVVGRHATTGALVSSRCPSDPHRIASEAMYAYKTDDLRRELQRAESDTRLYRGEPQMEAEEQFGRLTEAWEKATTGVLELCEFVEAVAEQWSTLPLIVLAGLR